MTSTSHLRLMRTAWLCGEISKISSTRIRESWNSYLFHERPTGAGMRRRTRTQVEGWRWSRNRVVMLGRMWFVKATELNHPLPKDQWLFESHAVVVYSSTCCSFCSHLGCLIKHYLQHHRNFGLSRTVTHLIVEVNFTRWLNSETRSDCSKDVQYQNLFVKLHLCA